MSPKAAAYAALVGCWLATVTACVDPLVVGEQPACEPECPPGLHCSFEVELCVQCMTDDDCSVRLNAPHCEGFGCVQCRTPDDCADNRQCVAGACVQCMTDADCNNGREPFEVHVCSLGACVDRF